MPWLVNAAGRLRLIATHTQAHRSTTKHTETQQHMRRARRCTAQPKQAQPAMRGGSSANQATSKRSQISIIKPNPQFHLQINRDGIGWASPFRSPPSSPCLLLLVVASALGMGRAQWRCSALARPMRGACGSERRGPGVCVGVCVWFGLVLALSLG